MKYETLLLSAGLLTGCATSSQTYTPDGRIGHSINCSGAALNWGMCYEKAGELCKEKGYTVVGGGVDQGFVASSQFAGSVMSRALVIQCKE